MPAPTPKHLLHICATFASGGYQMRTLRVAAALGAEFRHSLVALDGQLAALEQAAPGLELRVVPAPPRAGAWKSFRALRELLRREQPDALLTYNWGAIEAAAAGRSLGLAVQHHEDGFRPDEVLRQKQRRVWFRRLVLARCELVVPSRVLERIALDTWKLARERVHCIPNGIRLEPYAAPLGNAELRARVGLPREACVVGTVAHLRAEKNIARLLGALAHAPGLHALVIGDGPERAALEQRAAELGLGARAHFAGHQNELADWYRACDLFALSSDTEQMPVSLLEAMASALPVAATDVGDVRAMLPPEQHAFLVAPAAGAEGERALAAALVALASDAQLRARFARPSRSTVSTR